MLGIRPVADQKSKLYATGADFCRIFQVDMNRLYLLSFLLTGDRSLAENCFVRGLEDAGKGNPVFKEWARSWARRTIIQKAIEIVQPRRAEVVVRRASGAAAEPSELVAILTLPAFERFVFVMSVLERNSDQECSLLLDCSRAEVATARSRALQRIGRSAELQGKATAIARERQALPDDPGASLGSPAISHLPASA